MGGRSTNVAEAESEELLPPLDFTHLMGDVAKKREKSGVKDFYKYMSIPGIGQLAAGFPNASFFLYDTLEGTVALPERFAPSPNYPDSPQQPDLSKLSLSSSDARTKKSSIAASHILVPKISPEPSLTLKIDLTTALQYGKAEGYPPLFTWLRQFTRENLHPTVPYKDGPDIVLSCGNTDGFAKVVEVLSNEWVSSKHPVEERPGLLVEGFCYMTAVQTVIPRGLNIVPVTMDEGCMNPHGKGGLLDVLENWDFRRGRRPHLLYTVTVGQNPTGGTVSVEQRKEIYALCQKFDVIIIEDDPYWFLQYPSAVPDAKRGHFASAAPLESKKKSSGYAFLDSLVPSYLSVDRDGRVVRLDTFSKTVAPGCRLGWITAQPAIVERIVRIAEMSTQQPSGFVQSLVAELIMGPQKPSGKNGKGWLVDGWVRWLEGLRGSLERRMQTMCTIMDGGKVLVSSQDERHSGWSVVKKTQIYSFNWPQGGMFIWVKMDYSTHPLASQFPLAELANALWVWLTTEPYLLLVTPGGLFSPTPEINAEKAWAYFRVCFSAIPDADVESCSHRFVEGVQAFWRTEDSQIMKLKGAGNDFVPLGC